MVDHPYSVVRVVRGGYVTDLGWRDTLSAAYLHTFPEPLPTRTMVEVRPLPYGAPVEMEVIAHRETPAEGS